MQGRGSGKVRDFALYGETTGETDEFGLPVRYNWAAEYRGQAMVVYGHTPVPEPEWLNRTINIDTGCVFGGRLTALRYPEKELVSVPAAADLLRAREAVHLPQSAQAPALSRPSRHTTTCSTSRTCSASASSPRGSSHSVTIREENATAALEVMSRFAANPKWLIYLPPTMSPARRAREPGLLEHPAEAFAYYRARGRAEGRLRGEAHGSRAVVIVCRDEAAARRRFGVVGTRIGICLHAHRPALLRGRGAETAARSTASARRLAGSGLWDEFKTDWVCLDCELMPWSAKAQELLRTHTPPWRGGRAAALRASCCGAGTAR